MRARRSLAIGVLIGVTIGAAAVAGASGTVSAYPQVIHQTTSIVASADGDLFAEKGESVSLTVEIRNVGTVPATGITATLTFTGFAMRQARSSYPDLGPGAAATNVMPFITTALPGAVTCGDGPVGTLNVRTAQGSFLARVVVPVSAVSRSESWTSTTPVVISDLATVESPLALGAGSMSTILDMNVRINDLSHTWVGDLVVSLLAPSSGEPITFATRRGLGPNFTNTVFDDEASTALADGSPPFTGAFLPDALGMLSAADGADATGTWRLRVQDYEADDTGRLNSWSIDAITARCNEAPSASIDARPLKPVVGKRATLRANSADSDGRIVSQAWDLDFDRQFDDGTGTTVFRTFTKPGSTPVYVRVVDDLGNATIGAKDLTVLRACRVPRVVGRSLAAARLAIRRGGCRIGRVRRARSGRIGRVLRQTPRGGAQRPYGAAVNLVVGRR